jgi:methylated-DNA-[protein]-cysteine S-methyltransferase
MSQTYYAYYESPIGLVEIAGTDSAITALQFVESRNEAGESHPYVEQAAAQVAEYFAGQRREFNLDLEMAGTDFQKHVWRELLTIPYGETVSYQNIATALGNPHAVRAVGAANGQNPISIIVPCHRVVGSNGRLTGYGGGLWRKEWLLNHEGCLLV